MSWIKENKFIAGLAATTLVVLGILYFFGSSAAAKYDEAKQKFDEANSEATSFESMALYPKVENKAGKTKALDEYRKAVEGLQASFEPFRSKELENVSSQAFTDSLRLADEELRKAFEQAGTKVPDAFFVGFERYQASLAPERNTGILSFQLQAIKQTLLDLAKSSPSALLNLYRPNLAEEDGQAYAPGPNDVARALPFEISFIGPERSAREFLSAITKLDKYFISIKSLRVSNAKKDPPKASDAKFDAKAKPAAAKAETAFGEGISLPGDSAPAAGEQPAVAAPSPPVNSGRILSQVLGSEEIQVFVRLEVLQFLPAKKLP